LPTPYIGDCSSGSGKRSASVADQLTHSLQLTFHVDKRAVDALGFDQVKETLKSLYENVQFE
jgi:hypothetical protein